LKTQQHIILFSLSCLIAITAAAQQSNFEFVENKGQWDRRVQLMGSFGAGHFFLEKKGFTVLLQNPEDLERLAHHSIAGITTTRNGKPGSMAPGQLALPTQANEKEGIRSHAYRVSFEGASDQVEIIPDKLQDYYTNYIIGNDSSKWAHNCKVYRAVLYRNVYPGIDIRYYSDGATLKYDIVVNPGASADAIAMKYEGTDGISIQKNQLRIKTSVGEVQELHPYSYQYDKEKGKTDISCKYEIVKGNKVKFRVRNYAKDIPLIIDPTFVFSTFTGSGAENWGFTATPGPDGSLYAGGIVDGAGYPLTAGAFQSSFGGPKWDMGITRFNTTGTSRIYSTYLGGDLSDYPLSLFADPQGNLVIMGRTNSDNYPGKLVGPGGASDLVVTKLNAAGTAAIGSLRIGGTGNDAVNIEDQRGTGLNGAKSTLRFYGDDSRGEVILDAAGNIYVASQTQSANFPVTPGVFQPTLSGAQDGVLLKIDPNCQNVIFSTFIGGTADDAAFVLDISPTTGNLYVGGATYSNADFPGSRAGVLQGANLGFADGFVTEVTNDGTAIIRTTFLGTPAYDAIYGLKIDKAGFPYVMGITEGDWTVVNAIFVNPGSKQFVAKLQPDLSAVIYSTVFGSGSLLPNISPVAFLVDRCENLYISGWGSNWGAQLDQVYKMAGTQGMPTTPDAIKTVTDNRDFYFIVIKKNASALLYGSFFGAGGGNALGDHVDGGTSRFDKQGAIYQAICSCGFGTNPPFLISPGAAGPVNPRANAGGCNLAAIKISFNFAGVAAGLKSYIHAVPDSSGCAPLTVELKDTIRNAASYEWHFGDGSPMQATTNSDITHTYNTIGTYQVMLVAIDSTTCNIRDTVYIHIRARNDEALLDFAALKLAPCQSLSYRFDNLSTLSPTAKPFTGRSFTWDFGDGTPRVITGYGPVTHSFAAPGTYNVRLILPDTNYCNSPDSITRQLRVAPLVKAQFETPPTGCSPYNALFNNTSLAGQSFSWNFGDGNTSTDVSPTHLYSNPGTYTITLIATDTSTCNKVDTYSIPITVSGKPSASFTYSPLTPKENTPYTFSNTSSPDAIRFKWNFGDGDTLATTSRADIEHQYNKSGTFNSCLVAINITGCADTACAPLKSIVIPLLDLPNAFTPLGNAANNVVYVRGFGIGKMKWRIYNRFGNLVFESSSQVKGWDGKFKGVVQPMDVYAYTLEVEFTDGTKATKKGDITLLR
jgi:gliding motility-associated-like protein